MNSLHRKRVLTRGYQPSDARDLAAIYHDTIHHVNQSDYSKAQLEAWAPKSSREPKQWVSKWQTQPPIVAELDGVIVGFTELEPTGHIDCFFFHHKYQRQGVGAALMAALVSEATKQGLKSLDAKVSITAKAFFESKGFGVQHEQMSPIRGVELKCYLMVKSLSI